MVSLAAHQQGGGVHVHPGLGPAVKTLHGLQGAAVGGGVHLRQRVFGQAHAFGQGAGANALGHQGLRQLLHAAARLLRGVQRPLARGQPVLYGLGIQRRATGAQHQAVHHFGAAHGHFQGQHGAHAVAHQGDGAALQGLDECHAALRQAFEGVGLNRRAVPITGHVPRHGAVACAGQHLHLGGKGEVIAVGVVQHQHRGAGAQDRESGKQSHTKKSAGLPAPHARAGGTP